MGEKAAGRAISNSSNPGQMSHHVLANQGGPVGPARKRHLYRRIASIQLKKPKPCRHHHGQYSGCSGQRIAKDDHRPYRVRRRNAMGSWLGPLRPDCAQPRRWGEYGAGSRLKVPGGPCSDERPPACGYPIPGGGARRRSGGGSRKAVAGSDGTNFGYDLKRIIAHRHGRQARQPPIGIAATGRGSSCSGSRSRRAICARTWKSATIAAQRFRLRVPYGNRCCAGPTNIARRN